MIFMSSARDDLNWEPTLRDMRVWVCGVVLPDTLFLSVVSRPVLLAPFRSVVPCPSAVRGRKRRFMKEDADSDRSIVRSLCRASAFFSKNPLHVYSTVPAKCLQKCPVEKGEGEGEGEGGR